MTRRGKHDDGAAERDNERSRRHERKAAGRRPFALHGAEETRIVDRRGVVGIDGRV